MSILNQINLKTGDYIPEEAHVEGSFNYYLWKAYLLVISKISILKFSTNQINFTASNNDYGQALLASRILTAVFSSMSVFLLLFILNELKTPYTPKIITLLLYGTNLIEVVHGHFMRPHTLSNLLLLLVIFVTIKTKYTFANLRFILAGFFSGLALATRYNNIAIIIPTVYILIIFLKDKNWFKMFRSCLLTGIFFILGFFVGDPAIFTNFKTIEPFLRYQSTFIAENQFTIQGIFDISRIKKYLTYLIPFASFPTSWILIYSTSILSLFFKNTREKAIPLLSFACIYLFLMAKGYSEPIFARATLPIFPPLIVVSALSLTELFSHSTKNLIKNFLCFALIIPSAIFTLLYVIGLQSSINPQDEIFNYFSNIKSKTFIKIYSTNDWLCDYYIQGSLYANSSRFEFLSSEIYSPNPGSYYISCEIEKNTNIVETANFIKEIPFTHKINLNLYLPSDLMYPYLSLKIYKN